MTTLMRMKLTFALLVLATTGVELAHASDRVAVYAKVDKVVLEPNANAPVGIQVWGTFSVAIPKNPNDYLPAGRGYLYYKVATNPDATRREWADLMQVAGTGQIVAFGLRWEGTPTLRSADTKPANPDPYTINVGVVKVTNTQYAPIRALTTSRP